MAIYSAARAAARAALGTAGSLVTSYPKQPRSERRQDDGQSAAIGSGVTPRRASTGPVTRLGLLWRGGGSYLGRVDQPPGVEQAEAVLVAVAEASLVGVPLGVAILVLQGNAGYRGERGSPAKPGLAGRRPGPTLQQRGGKPARPY